MHQRRHSPKYEGSEAAFVVNQNDKVSPREIVMWIFHIISLLGGIVIIISFSIYAAIHTHTGTGTGEHAHIDCYVALTNPGNQILNLTLFTIPLASWTLSNREEAKSCKMGYNESGVSIGKKYVYEIYGSVVLNVLTGTTPSPLVSFPQVYRLYILVDGEQKGNYGEGFFFSMEGQYGESTDAIYGAGMRASTSIHHHLELEKDSIVTLAVGPSAYFFFESNFSMTPEQHQLLIEFQGNSNISVDNADLSVTKVGTGIYKKF